MISHLVYLFSRSITHKIKKNNPNYVEAKSEA